MVWNFYIIKFNDIKKEININFTAMIYNENVYIIVYNQYTDSYIVISVKNA